MAKKAKTRQPSTADIIRLGADVASVKAQTAPKDWAKIVKAAHAGGWTVAGALSGDAPALRERTQASLRAQAQRTVNQAYAPAEKTNADSLSKIAAWDEKRKADNASYEEWLSGQRDKQAGERVAAMTALAGVRDNGRDQVAALWGAAPGQAQQALASQPGTVSDFSNAKALDFSAPAAYAQGQTQATGDKATATGQSIIDTQGIIDAADRGMAQAREGQRIADTSQARQTVLDKQSTLAVQKAADVLKAYTDAQNQQISIAQGKADNSLIAQRLGLQTDTLAETIRSHKANEKNAADATAASKATSAAKLRLEQSKADYNGDGTIDAKDRTDKVADQIKVKQAGKSLKSTAPNASQEKRSQDQWSNAVTAYHVLQDWHAGKGAPKHSSFREVLRRRGLGDLLIDVAEDLRKNGGKLSARGRKKALEAGILNPETLTA